jgi:N-acylglucosamine-6-phosphate 2-epimerase
MKHEHTDENASIMPTPISIGRQRFCKPFLQMGELFAMTASLFPPSLKNKLIVSCQAASGDPLDHVETLTRIAISSLRGGAAGLRANGAKCIAAFRRETDVPILGIQKKRVAGEISITPDFESAKAVAQAGADVIALDCSAFRQAGADSWQDLILRIHAELDRPALADIATYAEAHTAEANGADAVATTLYGFTPETEGACTVNWVMVEQLAKTLSVPLIVEGHISHPDEVRRAFDLGAFAVVVGSAITRPQSITARFAGAIFP